MFQFFVNAFQTAFFFDFYHTDAAAFRGGFHKHRQAQFFFNGIKVAVVMQYGTLRNRQTHGLPNQFAAVFVHTQRGSSHTAAGIRNTHQFQRALNRAIFAESAVQNIEGRLKPLGFQFRQRGFFGVKRMGIHAFAFQGSQNSGAAVQRNFALAGEAAHQHGHFAKILHNFYFLKY